MTFLRQIVFLIAALLPGTLLAGTDGTASSKPGLLVMSHGGSDEWNAAVREAVSPLRSFCPVEIAFGMAQRDALQGAVSRLETQGVGRVAVVRLFVSAESFRHQTEYLLGLRSDPPRLFIDHSSHSGVPLTDRDSVNLLPGEMAPSPVHRKAAIALNTEGLYDSELIGDIIAARVQNLSLSPESESVLVLAHGEGDDAINRRWIFKLNSLAAKIRRLGPFRTVQVETLREDWHDKRNRAEQRIRRFVREGNRDGGQVIVVPFRVFGFGPYASVLQDLTYLSDGLALLPHSAVTEWIRQQAGICLKDIGANNPFQASSFSGETDFDSQ